MDLYKRMRVKAEGRMSGFTSVSLGLVLLAAAVMLSGCFNSLNTIGSPIQSAAPAPDDVKTESVVTGTFVYPGTNPMNTGTAEVTQVGTNKYHLRVDTVHGFAHNIGEIESDFTFEGKRFVLSGKEYAQVNLSFAENSITIDYPGTGFGGLNAEPKGTFYLQNSGAEDAPFLTRLFDTLKLSESYRHGMTDVFTYTVWSKKEQPFQQILLVRSSSKSDRSFIVSQFLAVYDPSSPSFTVLGELTYYNSSELRKALENLKADPETIYRVLHKDYYDRVILLQMEKFDSRMLNQDNLSLTDAEAFYIITGIEGKTSITKNNRDPQNIGSIFVMEVENSDAGKVIIHDYEIVRNDETDTHNATHNRFEVDRATGTVSSFLF